jgi:hypothetical protein
MYQATITKQSTTPTPSGNYRYDFDVMLDGKIVDSCFVESLPENVQTNIQVYLDGLSAPVAPINLVGEIVTASPQE